MGSNSKGQTFKEIYSVHTFQWKLKYFMFQKVLLPVKLIIIKLRGNAIENRPIVIKLSVFQGIPSL